MSDHVEQTQAHKLKPVDAHGGNLDRHDPADVLNPEHVAHHTVSPVTYAAIFGVLVAGTVLTVIAAELNLGPMNPVVALAIAVTKAVFVVLFFMHVKYSSRLVKLTVAAGFFTFLVLVTMSLSDYVSRAWGLW